MFDKLKDGEFCPLVQGKCKERACRFWVQVVGTHPQTQKPIDHYNCAVAWLPILMIENSQMQRQTGAAVESFRNEMVEANKSSQKLLMETANHNAVKQLRR